MNASCCLRETPNWRRIADSGWLLNVPRRQRRHSLHNRDSTRPTLGDGPAQTIATADVETVMTALRNGRSATGGLHAPVKLKKSAEKIREPRAASSINPIVAGSPTD